MILSVKELNKKFFKNTALENISIDFNEGEIFGLLGPNGAGKTTLIRLINKILTLDSGIILFNGKNLKQSDLYNIGYLPEERGLYQNLKVQEHIVFLAQLRGLSKSEAIEQTNYWLNKFDIINWKNKRIEELSKGMAQKIQFICSVVHNPDLLILDEPLSGFDPINIHLIVSILHELKEQGKTIILSTHDMKSVEEICDRVALINNSKLIAIGSVDDIRRKNKTDHYGVRFKGDMISFSTALWVDFELIDKKEVDKKTFEVTVKKRKDLELDGLIKSVIDKVKIEAVWEIIPSMQDTFINLVNNSSKEEI